MGIATTRWMGFLFVVAAVIGLSNPLAGLAVGIAGLGACAAWCGMTNQRHLRSVVSHSAVTSALAARDDCAFALFDGGRRPAKRVALIAAQLEAEDLVVPLDNDIAVVLARAGPHDRLLARLCRCQLALQNAGCRGGAIGAVRPGAQDAASAVLSRASQALVEARARGPFEIECANIGRAVAPAPSVGIRPDRAATDTVSAILCASTGSRMGVRPLPDFGPFAATTLTQLTGRLAHCAGIARSSAGSIVLPVSAELVMDYGTIDALGVVLDATEIAPDRLILCPDEPLFPGGQLRDLGVRLATPLLTHNDADLAADGLLWLPAATTRCAARDPGRHALLADCLSAAGERDIPVLALDIADPDDATLLSQLGVSWIEGSAVCSPLVSDPLLTAPSDPATGRSTFDVIWMHGTADRAGVISPMGLPVPGRRFAGKPEQHRAGRA